MNLVGPYDNALNDYFVRESWENGYYSQGLTYS